MKMTLMGTGTSHGVPVIGCSCKVCSSADPRDNRTRCSAYISEPARIVIDTGPEFRIQALKFKIQKLDAVLITHSHADHLHGIDDLRIFSHSKYYDPTASESVGAETAGAGLDFYAGSAAIQDIRLRFDYIFKEIRQGGGKPKINPIDCGAFSPSNPIRIGGLEIVPVPLKHGCLDDTGFLVSETRGGAKRSVAYLTDCNFIPESSLELVRSNAGILEHLVIDGLREKGHSTHFSFLEALGAADLLGARNTYLTHITHNMAHAEIQEYISRNLFRWKNLSAAVNAGGRVEPAYDGLELEI